MNYYFIRCMPCVSTGPVCQIIVVIYWFKAH